MKFEIELKDVKKANNKQKFILGKLIAQAKVDYESNNMYSCFDKIELYNKYAASLNGEARRRVAVKGLYPKDTQGADILGSNKSKYLKLAQELYKVEGDHKPKNLALGQWVGVEIECFVPGHQEYDEDNDEYQDIDETETFNEIKREIQKNKIKYVSMKHDGSIDPESDYIAIEFTVLTRMDDMKNLEQLCQVLEKVGAKVNSSCGLHIHLDQRDVYKRNDSARSVTRKELAARVMRLNQALPLLASIVPKSRRTNRQYCRLEKSTLRTSTRYIAINTQSLSKFGTVEVRLHSATTNFVKISNWIKLCYGISRCAKIKNSSKHSITSIEQLKTKYMTDMPLDMVTYFTQRIEKFKDDNFSSHNELNEYNQDRLVVSTGGATLDRQTLENAISYLHNHSQEPVIASGDLNDLTSDLDVPDDVPF